MNTYPTMPQCGDSGLRAILNIQFLQNGSHMILDGLLADSQSAGDLSGWETGSECRCGAD